MNERDRSQRQTGRPTDRGSRGGQSGGRGPSRRDAGGRESGGRGRQSDRDTGPSIPEDVAAADLDGEVRRDLLTLDKANAERVAKHLVMVSRLLDEDPSLALEHARAARGRASRVGVVRETAGIAAYTAGEWQEAITELRAARRITGSTALLPLIADAERGLGRPDRAIEIARGTDGRALSGEEASEMRIVEAGARMDLGEPEKAVVTLQAEDLRPGQTGTMAARIFYAYASALAAAGRRDDAITWFMNAASADVDDVTDAEYRLAEYVEGDEGGGTDGVDLSGVDVNGVEPTGVLEDEVAAPTATPASPATPTAVSAPAEPATSKPSITTNDDDAASDEATVDPVDLAVADTVAQAPAAAVGSGVPTTTLADSYDALLLDLDGTVFAGHQALPNAVESLERVATPQFFVTNNASRRPAEVAAHLVELGFDATEDLVVTSAQTAARLLSEHVQPGARALVVGTDGLAQEVREVGVGVTRSADDRPAAVIQGHSTETGWAELSEAALAIRAGALWIATNVDATLPSERGLLVGNGSMVAALKSATGKEPLVAGKPAAPLMADAISRSRANRPLVVGDRLDTDIEGAHSVGIHSALVLTGVSGIDDVLVAPPEQRPTYLIDDLSGLFADPDAVRVAPQPGWEIEVDGPRVTVSGDGAPQSLLPALAAAVWAGFDEQATDTRSSQSEDLSVRAVGDAARDALVAAGVRVVG
ncbi:HAD-IIA family hydrolase [Gordonia sp. ABSL1-1]|uniref:HAD-IIA family hydrolase n=1 Tax=Gordonia sp. ABSL1-1 TaxID=3053923 RepID=UPI0025729814|nr:HAD-IIA family hydrolase [Gordonia sp. ABSL1-1]MDL9937186.1 HAD-IIA family hydrolase [Gordonia sp. ABSL1-1]